MNEQPLHFAKKPIIQAIYPKLIGMIFNRSTCKACLLFLFIFWQKTVLSQAEYHAINITDRDGLPQNKIKSIVKDSIGYIWVGTQNGIAQYNGHRFKSYPALSGIEITSIFLSGLNDIWVGTHQGLFLLDRTRDQFHKISLGDIRHLTAVDETVYFITPEKMYHLKNGEVAGIELEAESYLRQIVLSKDKLFLGRGRSNGLIAGKFTQGHFNSTDHFLSSKVITCLRAIDNKVWAGTSDGQLYQIQGDSAIQTPLSNSHPIKDIVLHQGQLWAGTDGNGVFIIDSGQAQAPIHFTHNQGKKNLIGSNNIQSILPIDEENIWIGTYDAGVYVLSSNQRQFQKLQDLYHTDVVNLSESATAFYQDSKKRLLLGTPGGFVRINPATDEKAEFGLEKCQNLLGGSKVLSIAETHTGDVLVGTYDGGLGRFTEDLKFKNNYYPFGGIEQEQNINFILPLGGSQVLVSSMYKGMVILNTQTGSATPIKLLDGGQQSIKFPSQALRQFKANIYTYVFGKSIYQVNTERAQLEELFSPPIPINDFHIDEEGNFWLATRGEGLIYTNPKGEIIKRIDMDTGLPSNFLIRIEKDQRKNMWISSISGLGKIDSTGHITTFDHRHGLPSKEFTPFTSSILENHQLLFGTVRGFILANTATNLQESPTPNTVISDITFQNQSIKTLDEELLSSPIETLSSLNLPFERNSFTIHFFNDDYSLPKFNKSRYRMIGLEEEWIDLDDNTQTTYTNLSPGTYQFEVSSTNKYGVANEQATRLSIVIAPPWYMSWWAYLAYFLGATGLGFMIYRVMLYHTHMLKELEFSAYKLQTTKELNEKKLQFFTNITHDFKTPLTLISAPLEELLKDEAIGGKGRQNLGLIKRNSERLHHLIIDLLDFRKINYPDTLKLEVSATDMDRFLQDIYDSFKSACEQQQITLTLSNSCTDPTYIDPEKVKRILWNILSNALKFTPKGGEIAIACDTKEAELYLSIIDTGKGMSESQTKQLFDRYYQTGHEVENKELGTGLGMAIVKGLISNHRGKIKVSSQPGKGTAFHLLLPMRKEAYAAKELNTRPKGNYTYLPPIPVNRAPTSSTTNTRYNLPKLLICEDNQELNTFLVQIFERDFKVITCFNGMEGLRLAKKKSPDLIISDVMMPKMDGYEFCEKIKTNTDTSHTPVILLTANSSLDKQIKGMSLGADIYITKPFKTEFLQASVRSVLENRQKLRTKFQGLQKVSETEESITPHDQQFMSKLKAFMSSNLSNQELSIDVIAEEMNCSKSSLIRKVKSLTGITPMAFLRTYRLKTAYELLTKENLTVSEASYKTGFSDPNYFATSFKKQYGKNPSQIK